jgi:hypothetical protein
MSDIPEKLGSDVFIVGAESSPKWVVLGCPCGCGDKIEVNLQRSRRPVWMLREKGGKITLDPSLWVSKEKCGSHFWIRDGRVIWARDFLTEY